MRILVVDDSLANRRSAEVTLTGHKVTILENYDDAMTCMGLAMAEDPAESIRRYCEHYSLPAGLSRDPEQYAFDVVLLDLMLPASMMGLGLESMWEFRRKPLLPYGLVMAMYATKIPSVQRVAVVTATNHHDHPMNSALDYIGLRSGAFLVDGKWVRYLNYGVPTVDDITESMKCPECKGTGMGRWAQLADAPRRRRPKDREPYPFELCENCRGTKKILKYGKDWGAVLREVLSIKLPEGGSD